MPIQQGYICPNEVSSENWLGDSRSGTTFSVEQDAGSISVTRSDRPGSGWKLDLTFHCCRGESTSAGEVLYLGCFNDNGDAGRDLDSDKGSTAVQNVGPGAVAECAAACSGYSYMGLQWANECWCGNTYGTQGEAEDATFCDADGDVSNGYADLCANGEGNCGNLNAVYAISGTHAGAVGDTPGQPVPELAGLTPQTFSYIGCFVDSGNRDFTGPSFGGDDVQGESGTETAMNCADACTGFRYMGLQHTNECYCDNRYGDQGEAEPGECDADGVVEAGGVADACGAGEGSNCGWRNAVYRIDYSAPDRADHGERVQPCSNFAEFSALLPALNDVCCRDGSCVAGLPTQCNVRCAAKLMPLQLACRDFFDANQQATGSLSGMIDSAAALCSGGH